jgi:hypothetical protein
MKKKMAMKLVKALRSGEYKQGNNRLVDDDDRFCCLGVACNISSVDLDWKLSSFGEWLIGREYLILPEEIQSEFGFHDNEGVPINDGFVKIKGETYLSLSDANDSGVSFGDIADYIVYLHELVDGHTILDDVVMTCSLTGKVLVPKCRVESTEDQAMVISSHNTILVPWKTFNEISFLPYRFSVETTNDISTPKDTSDGLCSCDYYVVINTGCKCGGI